MNHKPSDDMSGNNNGRIVKRPKRVLTPARKEQNRVAQRAYRECYTEGVGARPLIGSRSEAKRTRSKRETARKGP
ncbi:hypothetical protein BDV29DRAFT_180736 [Aspergillus leporis]|uniref:Uncharacterized protein n=1 Tax=Aspergillus leporis TaxID=41062 RepID=A0A5N5WTN0_9EURO|nr:hypothetical protein BDV29DRAFT_180736 [Aspergillus leporis]